MWDSIFLGSDEVRPSYGTKTAKNCNFLLIFASFQFIALSHVVQLHPCPVCRRPKHSGC